MAEETKTVEVNRARELDKLLARLRKKNDKYSDIDLVLKYIEEFISDPKMGGPSKKLEEFTVEDDPQLAARTYHLSWKRFATEEL
jgi:hypothetical protein